MKRILISLLAMVVLGISAASAQQSRVLCDTIPFQYIHGKIVIAVTVTGKPANFIVDTGGINIMVSDTTAYYGMEVSGGRSVGDANQATLSLPTGTVRDLNIGNLMRWEVANIAAVPSHNYFRELGVVGALGGEAFREMCMVIDKRNSRLVLTYPYRPPGFSRTDGTPMQVSQMGHANVRININGHGENMLFDTGMAGLLNLGQTSYRVLKNNGTILEQTGGYGFRTVGVAGIRGAVSDSIFKVIIPELNVGAMKFTHVGTVVEGRPGSIIGNHVLDYGLVLLDYPRGLFYFKPYEQANTDVRAQTTVWNVKIMPMEGEFHVTATFGDVGVSNGERVLAIGETDMDGIEQSEMEVDRIFDSVESDKVRILVGENRESARWVEVRKI